MIFISHRGNLNGKIEGLENNPDYIKKALGKYHVEIDLWLLNNKIYLGHDDAKYYISIDFLNNEKLFVHCKNHEAMIFMSENNLLCQYFWHENDDFTITSKGFIIAHPNIRPIKNSIAMLPEINNLNSNLKLCYGICSDIISNYHEGLLSNLK